MAGMFNIPTVPQDDPIEQRPSGWNNGGMGEGLKQAFRLTQNWLRWFTQLQAALTSNNPIRMPTYTLTTLPSAAANKDELIYVSNATGSPKLCYSNGVNWCLINTTTVVS